MPLKIFILKSFKWKHQRKLHSSVRCRLLWSNMWVLFPRDIIYMIDQFPVGETFHETCAAFSTLQSGSERMWDFQDVFSNVSWGNWYIWFHRFRDDRLRESWWKIVIIYFSHYNIDWKKKTRTFLQKTCKLYIT